MQLEPVEQLVLQGTPFCNIHCIYCDLSVESRRTKSQMPVELVHTLLKALIDQKLLAEHVTIVWHSGEPLTLPPAYYKSAIDTITDQCAIHAPGLSLSFDFQTNATLIDEAWCDFFEQYSSVISLGVSCDGPPELHNAFRMDRRGRPTFALVERGMNMLAQRGIKYNIIAVVSRKTMQNPRTFMDFFLQRRHQLTDFHFNVLASPISSSGELDYSDVDRHEYQRFYCELLDWQSEIAKIGIDFPIRNFSSSMDRLAQFGSEKVIDYVAESSAPLRSLNMDVMGNLTTFYAGLDIGTASERYGDGKGLSLGNIRLDSLPEMLNSNKFARMVTDFRLSHERCKSTCEYFDVCPGGFELLQMNQAQPEEPYPAETTECVIHVKALLDAVMDKVQADDASDLSTDHSALYSANSETRVT